MKKEILITKEQCEEGITLKLKKGTVVKVVDWVNKRGTNILFQAPVHGVYRINGKVSDYAS